MKVSKQFWFEISAQVAEGAAHLIAAAAVATLLLFFVASPATNSVRAVEGVLAIVGWGTAFFVAQYFFLVAALFRSAIEEGMVEDLTERLVEEHFWSNNLWYGLFGAVAAIAFFLAAHSSLTNGYYSFVEMGLFASAASVIAQWFYARGVRFAKEADLLDEEEALRRDTDARG